jgi:hypothetical protein
MADLTPAELVTIPRLNCREWIETIIASIQKLKKKLAGLYRSIRSNK